MNSPSPTEILGLMFAGVYAVAIGALALQGLHLLWMLRRWRRHRPRARDQEVAELERGGLPPDDELPRVLVQLPVFNERDVVERLVRGAAALDWPRDRLHIQVLDDSTDDTTAIGERVVDELRAGGVNASMLHRPRRQGYKAGALGAGMAADDAPFIAIFDADFVPRPDFLRRAMIPLLADAGLALVQGRWEHLNRDKSMLTRAQAVGIDAHFAVEQGARAWSGLAMNFNGTCGVWRREAIADAGGWRHDTLTEDLDLSYRVQLAGWRCTYREGLAVPGELPPTLEAFVQQQFRWAKGSIQTARKLLPTIWRSRWHGARKAAATMHLLHYLVHPLMLVALVVAPPAIWLTPSLHPVLWWLGAAMFLVGTGAPVVTYVAGQRALGRGGWRLWLDVPRLAALGTGIAISNAAACLEAARGRISAFERTPKGRAALPGGSYALRCGRCGGWELAAGCWAAAGIAAGFASGRSWATPILFIFAAGLLTVGAMRLAGHVRGRGEGDPVLRSRRRALALIGLVSIGGYALLALHPGSWRDAPLVFGCTGLALGGLWLLAAGLLSRWRGTTGALPIIVAVAVASRVLALGIAPSDDVNRYLVEGAQIEAWQNPYAHAPDSPEAREAALAAGIDERVVDGVNHPSWTAGYPPLALVSHALALRVEPTPDSMQLVALVAAMAALALVLALLSARGRRPDWLLIVAWCPLVPLFAVGEAHHDAVMMALVTGGLVLVNIGAERRGALTLGAAALVKPFAVWLLLPILWRGSWRVRLAIPALAALAYLPFAGAGWGVLASFTRFGTEMSFNGALEPLVRALVAQVAAEPLVRAWTVGILVGTLMAGSVLMLRLAGARGALRDPRLAAGLVALLLLCLPTLHAWYLLVLVPLLPVVRSWGLMLWVAMAPAYWLHGVAIQANGGTWIEDPLVRSLMHVPALLLLLWEAAGRPVPAGATWRRRSPAVGSVP